MPKTQFSHVHWSSLRSNWRTPKALYEELDQEFHFTLDPCPINPTCDGLSYYWKGSVFVNPPYGKRNKKKGTQGIAAWIKQGYLSSKLLGSLVVMLLPARTDTVWFHQYCTFAEIRFIKGQLIFQGAEHGAPFPSMIVIFRGGS